MAQPVEVNEEAKNFYFELKHDQLKAITLFRQSDTLIVRVRLISDVGAVIDHREFVHELNKVNSIKLVGSGIRITMKPNSWFAFWRSAIEVY